MRFAGNRFETDGPVLSSVEFGGGSLRLQLEPSPEAFSGLLTTGGVSRACTCDVQAVTSQTACEMRAVTPVATDRSRLSRQLVWSTNSVCVLLMSLAATSPMATKAAGLVAACEKSHPAKHRQPWGRLGEACKLSWNCHCW